MSTTPGRSAQSLDSPRPEPAVTDRLGRRRYIVLATMCVGMFLVQLDVTIVNVALPHIGAGLRTDLAGLQWVVDGYAVVLASLLLAGGALGDRYGHKRLVLGGLVLFGVASVLCALSPSAAVLIAARALQGVGAAALLPGTLAVITRTFPDRAEQARAVGLWAGVSALALPAGAHGVDSTVVLAAAVAVAAVAAFVAVEHSAGDDALVPLTLLRSRGFAVSNTLAAAMNFVGIGTIFVSTLYLQGVQGKSPLMAAAAMLPLFLPVAVLSPLAGRMNSALGPITPMMIGFGCGVLGALNLLRLEPDSPYLTVLPSLAGIGIGMGMLAAPIVAAAMRSVPAERSGVASAANNTARQAAGALGIAVFGAVDRFTTGMHLNGILAACTWGAAAVLAAATLRR